MTEQIAAVLATVVLAALGVLQVLVARGRPLGRYVWGGQHDVLPARLRRGSWASLPLYAVIAALLWSRAGLVLPGGGTDVVRVGAWVLVGYLGLGVVVNAVSRSPHERSAMTPAATVLVVCAVLVASS